MITGKKFVHLVREVDRDFCKLYMKKEIKKLSLEHCHKVLGNAGKKYSDIELLQIRDYLYVLAEVEYDINSARFQADLKVTELKNAA
jgi:hypothetical protein